MPQLAEYNFDEDDYTPSMTGLLGAYPARPLTPINPADPAMLGYPATFPIEIAMRTSPVDAICAGYHITPEQWDIIRYDPTFLGDLKRAMDLLKEEGASFKLKAKLSAEEVLKTAFRTIHDPKTPPNVAADLMKSVVRWAGYDAPTAAAGVAAGSGFSISINFNGDKPEMKTING